MRISVKIANKSFVPSKVVQKKPRLGKYATYKNLHYLMNTSASNTYPLELLIASYSELAKFQLVFIEDDTKQYFFGIYNGSTKKTFIVPSDTFSTHLKRYNEITKGGVAIVNSSEPIVSMDNAEVFEIKYLPPLVDPEKDKRTLTKAIILAIFSIVILFTIKFISSSINTENVTLMDKLYKTSTIYSNIASQTKLKETEQDKKIENTAKESFLGIKNGEIKCKD